MANIGKDYFTYSDLAKKMISSGNEVIGKVIEILSQTNQIIDDIPMIQCNNGDIHKTLIRSGLPEGYWRSINQGVPNSKSDTVQVSDKCAQLASNFQVDKDLVDLNNNSRDFMASEERAHLEKQAQTMARALFYSDYDEDDSMFMGLAPRYSTLDPEVAPSAANVIDARPDTDTSTEAKYTSAWLVNWGPETAHGIHPSGLTAGFERTAFMNTTVADRDGNDFIGHKVFYKWNMGLSVRDWRYIVRIANISRDNLGAMINAGAVESPQQKLVRLMIQASSLIPTANLGRPIWYMNRQVMTMLDLIAMEKSNVWLSIGEFEGRPVKTFLGVPIHLCDALTFDEMPIPRVA